MKSGTHDGLAGVEALPAKSLEEFTATLKKRWKRYRKELKCCRKDLCKKAIHDFRVEARRLLSSVELLAGFVKASRLKKIEAAVKEHLDLFADLRDTQVQLEAVDKLLRIHPAARPFQGYLAGREQRFTKKTRKSIKRASPGRLGKRVSAYREAVERRLDDCDPAEGTARLFGSIDKAFKRTRQLRAAIDPSDLQTIHRTRVAFKKFRYMAEALASYLPDATEEELERMHGYQTLMGDIQDARVLLGTLDKFLRKKEIEPGAASRFRTELLRRREWAVRVYLDAAGQLREFWPPERWRAVARRKKGRI